MPEDAPLQKPITEDHIILNMQAQLEEIIRKLLHDMNNTLSAPVANIDMMTSNGLMSLPRQQELLAEYMQQAKNGADSAVQQVKDCWSHVNWNQNARRAKKKPQVLTQLSKFEGMLDEIGRTAESTKQYIMTALNIYRAYEIQPGYERATELLEGAAMGLVHTARLAEEAKQRTRVEEDNYIPVRTLLSAPVDEAIAIYRGKLKKAQIGLDVTREMHLGRPREFYFMGNHLRMTQVLINIFSNMFYALEDRKHPLINVSTITHPEQQSYARISVINNGPPVDKPEEMFNGKSNRGSSGLGLPICRHIVENRFGGRIYTRNITPTEGLAYHIEIPTVE